MAREAIGVKRYVVRLTGEERAHLEAMLRKSDGCSVRVFAPGLARRRAIQVPKMRVVIL